MIIIKVIYQYLIALPILIVLTLLCALITMVCIPWKNSLWLNRIQAYWARCFCWAFLLPVKVNGLEHIQPGQSYVFVSNHQSAFDIFTIYGWLPVVFKWLIKKEVSRIPFVGWACHAAGHIFVDRSHAQAAMDSIISMEKELVGGVSTVIFPEGTRSKDGTMGRFKRGAFQIAWELSLPIIPVRLDGCYEVMNRYAKTVTRHPISMTVLPAVDPKQYASVEKVAEAVRQIIMSA